MPQLTDCTDEELLDELNDRVNLAGLTPAPGAVGAGMPGIPIFVVNLIKQIGLPRVLGIAAQEILDGKIPHGGGAALPVGAVVKLGEVNSRGAHGEIEWRKTGDRT